MAFLAIESKNILSSNCNLLLGDLHIQLMAPNSKAAKAFKTMGSMGYSGKVVKPVLKNLLKLYGNNWEFIEDENYRVLIDAIIESEDNKVHASTSMYSTVLSSPE